jgi:hypothetical protein
MSEIPAGIPQIPGEDAPEGFTKNYVTVFKGYFCRYACQKSWDNFHYAEILFNQELRDNARAIYNEQTEEEFHNALYDDDADYARLVRYVLDCLVRQGMFTEEKRGGLEYYYKTVKLYALCPQIVDVILPGIDSLVEQYDRQHPS